MRRQHALDLDRVHVVPAAHVHLLAPADEAEPALVVDPTEVAGAHETVGGERGRGLFGIAPVARHDRGGAQAHFAHVSLGHRLVVGVEQRQARRWRAADRRSRSRLLRDRRTRCRARCRLRCTSSASRAAAPNRRRASSASPGVTGPPPAMMSRTLERSKRSKSGWRSMSASCVGTPATVVIFSRASSSSASAARHRSMMNVVPPRCRLPGSLVMNPRCANDVPLNDRPPVSHAPPVSVCVMNASCRLQYTAPFGSPVVPDVKMIATGRSGSSASAGGASAPAHAQVDRARRLGSSIVSFGAASSSTAARSRSREPVVDARGDRTELGRGAVGEEILGARREHEPDHVALAHAFAGQSDRDLVGDAIDVGVGERPAAFGHVGDTIAEASSGLGDGGGDHERSVQVVAARRGRPETPAHPHRRASCARRAARRCADCSTRACACSPIADSTRRASTTSCAPRARRTAPSICTSRTRKISCARSRPSAGTR